MKEKKLLLLRMLVLTLSVGAGGVLFAGQSMANAQVTEDNLPQLLEKALREHPDMVMDVLRRNSEAVLDIAQQGSNLRRKHSLEAQWREDMKTPKSVRLDGRPVLGSPNAKVRIVAFSDFTCHFCQQASQTVDALLKEYGNTVSLVFKNLPLDKRVRAARLRPILWPLRSKTKKRPGNFTKPCLPIAIAWSVMARIF